jgi:integrase
MSRGRRWGSITREERASSRGAAWRVRAGDETRSAIGIFYDVDFGGGGRRGSLAAAEEALEEARRAWLALHQPRGRGAVLVAYGRDVLDRWEKAGTRRGIDRDRGRFEKHIAGAPFAADPIASIEHRQIQRWIRQLAAGAAEGPRGDGRRKRSRQTILNVLNLLRAILREAVEEDVIDESPARGVLVPRTPKEHEDFVMLTRAEVLGIIARKPDERVSLAQLSAIVVGAIEGLRPGELWGLRWSDVTGAELVVRRSRHRATKGGRVRRVPLLEPARAILARWRAAERKRLGAAPESDSLVWPGPGGGIYGEGYDAGWSHRRQTIRDGRTYTQIGVRWWLGVRRPVPFKDLRHTAASALLRGWWVDEGWIARPLTMLEVAQWLGHASITTTERHYAKLAPGGLLDVVPSGAR